MRRLPESHWAQSPRLPLGARAPHENPDSSGPTTEQLVRGWISVLQDFDAGRRSLNVFAIGTHAMALPDVLEALAKSVAAAHGSAGQPVLQYVADGISSARL